VTDPVAAVPIVIQELDDRDERTVSDFCQQVVLPNFRPEELTPEKEIVRNLLEGRARALVARTGEGTVAGGAYCDWFTGSSVLLLSYLAVLPEYRDLGVGARLLAGVRGDWSADLRPLLIVAEVEDPRYYHDTAFGDPARRARFYDRAGARALPLPYLQPALSPGSSRVSHLMLMVLGGSAAPPGEGRVDGRLVERFLAEYFAVAEGQLSQDDAEAQALLAACRRPEGLPLLPFAALPGY
jgi:GNAT superfamily N-acetyltransferase